MEKTLKRTLAAGVALAGAVLVGGAVYVYREKQTEEPDYRAVRSDGDFQIRDYPAITVAETVVDGPRKAALSEGFRTIADYIFAKSRGGEQIAMTVPVMQDAGDPMASDPPLFDDQLQGAWRTRFVMLDLLYGLAWTRTTVHGEVAYWHDGSTLTFGAEVYWFPNLKNGIVAFANGALGSNPAEQVLVHRLIEDKLNVPASRRADLNKR